MRLATRFLTSLEKRLRFKMAKSKNLKNIQFFKDMESLEEIEKKLNKELDLSNKYSLPEDTEMRFEHKKEMIQAFSEILQESAIVLLDKKWFDTHPILKTFLKDPTAIAKINKTGAFTGKDEFKLKKNQKELIEKLYKNMRGKGEDVSFDIPREITHFSQYNFKENKAEPLIKIRGEIYKGLEISLELNSFFVIDDEDNEKIGLGSFITMRSISPRMGKREVKDVFFLDLNYEELFSYLEFVKDTTKQLSGMTAILHEELVRFAFEELANDISILQWADSEQANKVLQRGQQLIELSLNFFVTMAYPISFVYADREIIKGSMTKKFNKKEIKNKHVKKPMLANIIVTRDRTNFSTTDHPLGTIDWEFHFWVQGHWRHYYADKAQRLKHKDFLDHSVIGHDRQGREVTGKTWVSEYKKGDLNKPLLERIIKRTNPTRDYAFGFK